MWLCVCVCVIVSVYTCVYYCVSVCVCVCVCTYFSVSVDPSGPSVKNAMKSFRQ